MTRESSNSTIKGSIICRMHTDNMSKPVEKGLNVKILNEGNGPGTNAGDLICITYDTFRQNSTLIEQNKVLAFVVGSDQTIEALDRGVREVKVGGVVEVTATPELAFGSCGLQPYYSGDDIVTFHVTIGENLGQFDYTAEHPLILRITLADLMRERGNFLYIRNEVDRAIAAYKTTMLYLFSHEQMYQTTSVEDCQLHAISVKSYNNLSAAYLKANNFNDADKCASTVLSLDPTNAKAMFRKGMALKGLGDYSMAKSFLQSALTAKPNELIRNQLNEVICRVSPTNPEMQEPNVHVEEEDEAPEATVKNTPPEAENTGPKDNGCVDADNTVMVPAGTDQSEEAENTSSGPITDAFILKAADTASSIPMPADDISTIPSWMKWTLGAAAVAGVGYLTYRFFKQ